MSTIQLENIKHPDAPGNALELASDGTLYAVGNVGVGTNTPTQKLHVQSAGANYIMTRDSTPGGIAGIIMQNGSDTRGIRINNATTEIYDHSAGVARVLVDASGRVTTPYQPFFSAYKSGNQGLAAHTPTKITTWSVMYDVGSGWDNGNNRWTAPVAGHYMIHFCAQSNVLGGLHVRATVNGNAGWCGDAWLDGGDVVGFDNSYVALLNANDYIEFDAYLTTAGNINANRTRITVVKVA